MTQIHVIHVKGGKTQGDLYLWKHFSAEEIKSVT